MLLLYRIVSFYFHGILLECNTDARELPEIGASNLKQADNHGSLSSF